MTYFLFKRLGAVVIALIALASTTHAFDSNADIPVSLKGLSTEGALITISSETVQSDGEGDVDFNFQNSAINDDIELLIIQVGSDDDTDKRITILPTPANEDVVKTGANTLTTRQSEALLSAGSVDPLVYALTNVLIRSPFITTAEAQSIGQGVENVIATDENSLTNYLIEKVGAQIVTDFKNALSSNSDSDLTAYLEKLNDAVAAETDAAEQVSLSESGALLGNIVIAAADAAGLDLDIVVAGVLHIQNLIEEEANFRAPKLSDAVENSKDIAFTGFFNVIKSEMNIRKYSRSVEALLGSQGNTFSARIETAFTTIRANFQAINENFAANLFSLNESDNGEAFAENIGNAYDTAFSTFSTNIRATDAEVAALKTTIKTILNITDTEFNSSFGSRFAQEETSENVFENRSIFFVAVTSFIASLQEEGTNFSYTRDAQEISDLVIELSSNRVNFFTQESFSDLPDIVKHFSGLDQDMKIIQAIRNVDFSTQSGPISFGEESSPSGPNFVTAQENYLENIEERILAITSPISIAQKRAILELLQDPFI